MTEDIITCETKGSTTVVTLSFSEITHELSERIQEEVTARIAERAGAPGGAGMSLVVDLTALVFLGSVGLTTLVILLKRTREAGGRMMVVGLAGQGLRVMELTRLTRIFELHSDVSAALMALKTVEKQ